MHTAARVYQVPGEAIWWHRMQETPSVAGAMPRSPLGELTALPRPSSWWEETDCPLSNNPPALGPSGLASPVPHSKIVPVSAPTDAGWRRHWISYRLYDWNLCFPVYKVGFYCFCIQALGLIFHIVGYISTVVTCVICVYTICVVLPTSA